MKRITACILAVVFLAGCSAIGKSSSVNFYYPRAVYEYNSPDGVIASESRDHEGNTSTAYLLNLYLKGPVEEGFSNPFPPGVKVTSVYTIDSTVHITLNDALAVLSGAPLILACACIGRTAMDLSDTDQAHIQCQSLALDGKRTVVISDSTVFFSDTQTETQSEDE